MYYLNYFIFPYSTLFFAFLLPAVQICFFCVAIGQKPSNLKYGVVNEEIQPFGSICDFEDGFIRIIFMFYSEKSFRKASSFNTSQSLFNLVSKDVKNVACHAKI